MERFITPDEAISLLNEGNYIHTFRQLANGIIVGCDWKRKRIISHFRSSPGKIQIAGPASRGMKHGIVTEDNGFLFIETNEEKLNAFDSVEV